MALATSAATGWFLLHLAREITRYPLLLRGALACGIGLFVSSMLEFLLLIVGGASPVPVVVLDFVMLGGAVFLWWRAGSQVDTEQDAPAQPPPAMSSIDRVMGIAVAAGLVAHAYASLLRHRAEPLGFWDAFAIWNLKARFFFVADGAHWERAFSNIITWSHTDYPVLVPSGVARLWLYGGDASTAASALHSFVFFVLTVALAHGTLSRLAGTRAAGLCALALLATPAFAGQAVWQVADIPLAFWLLGALSLLLLGQQEDAVTGTLTRLAGLFAGAAALTKNEGVLFGLVIFGVLVIADRGTTEGRARQRGMAFLQGAAAPILLLAIMKFGFAGESDLATDFGVHSLARLFEIGRHLTIATSFVQTLLTLTGWPLLIVLLASAVLSRFASGRGAVIGLRAAAAIVAVQLLGYYGVYLITERDLAWHLGTSNLRLFVQLWPSALLLFFAATASQSQTRSRFA